MSTKENRSIAYIYNEMDPSEKLEFERDLQNDSDLLIEVESLKKIARNLDQLEPMDPPAHVVEAVYQSAKKNKEDSAKGYWKPIIYSAAALLLIGMTSGIFLIEDTETQGSGNQQTKAASVTSGGTDFFPEAVNQTSISEKNLQPWVDNNEILYFQGQTASESSVVPDSIRNESLKKLTPVNPSGERSRPEELQLTGSHN